MQINVAEELKSIGKTTDRHLEESLEPISFGGNKLVFTMPLSVDVRSSFDGEGFSVSGVLSSELLMHCTKCNKEFKQGFNIDFSERFIKASEEEADEAECYPFFGETLELDKMILDLLETEDQDEYLIAREKMLELDEPLTEAVILEFPMKNLCREDCKGLCPVCGCDLNLMQCSCSRTVKNANFASLEELAQLLNNEEEV